MNDVMALSAFMAARYFAVIATASSAAKPEAAFLAYASNENHEIVIGTSNKSRKFQNIIQNKTVALVIADKEGEVQYEGEVAVMAVPEYESLIEAGTLPKLPGLDKYRSDPTQVYLRLKPTWIRFITHGDTDMVTEFTEFA